MYWIQRELSAQCMCVNNLPFNAKPYLHTYISRFPASSWNERDCPWKAAKRKKDWHINKKKANVFGTQIEKWLNVTYQILFHFLRYHHTVQSTIWSFSGTLWQKTFCTVNGRNKRWFMCVFLVGEVGGIARSCMNYFSLLLENSISNKCIKNEWPDSCTSDVHKRFKFYGTHFTLQLTAACHSGNQKTNKYLHCEFAVCSRLTSINQADVSSQNKYHCIS